MVEGIVVPVVLPHLDHALEVAESLPEPAVDLPRCAVGDGLLGVVLGFEDGDAADDRTCGLDPGLPASPAIPRELRPHFPLPRPRCTEARGGLFIDDIHPTREVHDRVGPACVQDRVAGNGMGEWERLGEGELNPALATRHQDRFHTIAAQGIVLEVELQCTAGTFERLGRVGRALEIAVVLNEGLQAEGFGVLSRHTLLVKRAASLFDPGGKSTSGDKVNGLGLRLPVLHVLAEELLRAGTEGGEHRGVDGVGEYGLSHC